MDEYKELLLQIVAERAAMLRQLREYAGCDLCKYNFEPSAPGCYLQEDPAISCEACTLDCSCAGCTNESRWEWVGIQEVDKDATH